MVVLYWSVSEGIKDLLQQGLNSLIFRGLDFWIHQNHCVFVGVPPNMVGALLLVEEEEVQLWGMLECERSRCWVSLHLVVRLCCVMVMMLLNASWELKGCECVYFGVSTHFLFFNINIWSYPTCSRKKYLYSITNTEYWSWIFIQFMYHIKQSKLDLHLDF